MITTRSRGVGIRLLGGLTTEGLDEHEIGSRKGRTVLETLALARGLPVSVDRLADMCGPTTSRCARRTSWARWCPV